MGNNKKMLFEAMHKVGGMPLNEDSYPPGGEEVDGVRRFGIKPFKGDDGRDRWITDEEWTDLLKIRDAISYILETKQWGDLVTSKWGFDDTFKHELYNVMGKIHKAYMDKHTPKD